MIRQWLHTLIRQPLLLYGVFFLLILSQFPRSNSLMGDTDSWFFLVAFETIANEFQAWWHGYEIGHALYPNAAVYPFGNYSPGLAPIYLIAKMMGAGSVRAWYCLYVAIFTTNAWGAYLIARQVHRDKKIALLIGFMFAACNVALGAMDNPDSLAYFPALASVYFFLQFIEKGKWPDFLATVLLGSLEVYFSSYAFLFGCVGLGLIGVFHLKTIFGEPGRRKYFLFIFPLFVLILLPYLSVYVFGAEKAGAWNPGESIEAVENVALHPIDWLRHLPEGLVWPVVEDRVGTHNWLAGTRSAGIGLLLWVLGCSGWWKSGRRRLILGTGFLIFVLLAFGPGFYIGETHVPNLLRPLYSELNLQNFFRISVRAWLPAVLILGICAGYALKFLQTKVPNKALLLGGIALLFALENIPYPFHTYENGRDIYETIPEEHLLQRNDDNPLVCLHLPASLYSGFHPDLLPRCKSAPHLIGKHEVWREYHYMWRQTLHKEHILNGFTGFIPQSRLEIQRYIDRLHEPGVAEEMVERFDIDVIIYHPQFRLTCEPDARIGLRKSPRLQELEGKEAQCFVVLPKDQ